MPGDDQSADAKSLLSRWKNRSVAVKKSIESRGNAATARLSTGQERLFFLQNLYPDNPFYNYADIYHFSGSIDVDILLAGLKAVVKHHKILHTTYAFEEGHVAQRAQLQELNVLDKDLTKVPLGKLDQEMHRLLRAGASEIFDLEHGPLIHVLLLRTRQGCSVLLNMHHIVMDKWSMRILREQWAEATRLLSRGEIYQPQVHAIDYLDYAHWEQGQTVDSIHTEYWKTQLSGEIPKLDLPYDYLRPARATFAGSFSRLDLEPELSEKLKQTAGELNCTLFVLILAAFKLVMSRYGDQKDVLIGTPVTTRDLPELESLIGFFNDTVVLRSAVKLTVTFRHFVQNLKKTVFDAFAHKKVSFTEVINELGLPRDDGRNPLFQVMFLYHEVPLMPQFGDQIEVHHEPFDLGVAKFDLTLYVENRHGKLSLIHEYSTELFEAVTIRQFEDSLVHVLEQVTANPQKELGQISLLTETQTRTMVNTWNDTAHPLEEQPGILNRMHQQAIAKPTSIAVHADGLDLTYEQLEKQSDNIATVLRGYVESNQKIGLCVPPSPATILGITGILKAGCAYVPLDPSYPEERLRFMIEDSQMTMLLTSRGANYTWSDLKILFIEDMVEDLPEELDPPVEDPSDLAYLIYTSGSSGRPKGVMVTRENLKYSTLARPMVYENVPESFLLMSSFSFDSSVAGIFWTLIAGGKLVMAPRHLEQDLEALQSLIEQQEVTHTLMLPSLYQLLLEFGDPNRLSSLKCIIVAGEACTPALVKLHLARLPTAKLYNEYGPTEATVWCTVQNLSQTSGSRRVAIGKPIPNAKAYIVNADHRPAPPGSAGELLIGGKGLTRGYFRREDLTRERFIQNPFVPGEKLYRTGDRARFRSDGVIDFLGRMDDQVKIRGYRIEPREIAETIERHEEVRQAVVLTPVDDFGNVALVAYVIASNALNVNNLRSWLKELLPGYMVPEQLHFIETFPLLPNGKIDILTLKSTVVREENPERVEASARSAKEEKLAQIWADVLGKPEIGIHQNFFSIGGDSIKSIQIIAKARALGLKIAPDLIFKHQTVAEMVDLVEELTEVTIDQGQGRGQLPWSPIQHWFFVQHQTAPEYWNQGHRIRFRNAIPKVRISSAVSRLIQHHDSLRLGFLEDGSAQYIEGNSLRLHSASAQTLPEVLQKLQKGFRLDAGNLFQAITIEDEFGLITDLVLVAHHLIVDAISWDILFDDLHTILDASPLVRKVTLPHKTNSYQDWTISLVAAAETYSRDLSWWKNQIDSTVNIPTKKQVEIPILEDDISVSHLIIDRDLTKRITSRSIQAMKFSVEDVLMLAFYRSWRTWSGSKGLNLMLERHGRDLDPDLDLSRTVGWFTSFFPLNLDLSAADSLLDQLSAVRALRLEAPRKGRDFGVLKYLLNEPLDYHWTQVVFNFLGETNPVQRPLFKKIDFLTEHLRDPGSERSYLLEVNLLMRDQQLHTTISYPKSYLDPYEMEKLLGAFDGELELIVDYFENVDKQTLQAGDFPETGLSQEGLDHLLSELT